MYGINCNMESKSTLVSPKVEPFTTSDVLGELGNLDDSLKKDNNKVNCEVCNGKARDKTALRIHNDISHLNILKFACDKCQYKSYYKSNIRSHKASFHNIKEDYVVRIGCRSCEKGFEHKNCIIFGRKIRNTYNLNADLNASCRHRECKISRP